MNCQDIKKLINLELDGLASDGEKQAILAHTESCPACSREKEELVAYGQAMKRLFSAAEVPAASAGLYRSLERRIAERPFFLGSLGRLWAPAGVVAALVLLALVVFPRVDKSPADVARSSSVISQAESARAAEVVDDQVKELLTNFL